MYVNASKINSDTRTYITNLTTIQHTYAAMYVVLHAKQKHLGCKKVRGQSEATLQTGRRDQKV